MTTHKEYLKQRGSTPTINITEKIFVTHHKPIREAQKEVCKNIKTNKFSN